MAKRKKNAVKPLVAIAAVLLFLIISTVLDKTGVWDNLANQVAPGSVQNVSIPEGVETLLTAHFIDVGQGDCTLFLSGDEAMLIDSGEKENAQTVLNTMDELGVKKLDYLVVTHAHTDHMGGMADILAVMPTEHILLSEPSDQSGSAAVYEAFLDAADASGAEIILAKPDMTFSMGYASCKVLAPFEVSQSEENNNSVVLHITAGPTSFLMTGDAETAVEKQIASRYPDLRATILKVGHHGSKTSTSRDFLTLLQPETAVISVGAGNSYGHPADDILTRLEDSGVKYYRTDISGTVTVTCTTETYYISTQR